MMIVLGRQGCCVKLVPAWCCCWSVLGIWVGLIAMGRRVGREMVVVGVGDESFLLSQRAGVVAVTLT